MTSKIREIGWKLSMKKKNIFCAALLLCAALFLSSCASRVTYKEQEEEVVHEVSTDKLRLSDEITEDEEITEEETPDLTKEESEEAETEEEIEEESAVEESDEDEIEEGPTVEESDEDETEYAGVLDFVDSNGNYREVEIDGSVTRHSYDWSGLTGSGLGLSYEDEFYTSRVGIDVCSFSGSIDWERVRNAGVEFAIIRIGGRGYGTAGRLYEDNKAMTYLEGARQAGLDVGVYFFSQAVDTEEAVEEADFVIDLLDGMELELPVVFDPETIADDVARTDYVTGRQFTENAIAFCERIRGAGYEPMVYCNMVWEFYWLDMAALEEAGIEIWCADYMPEPQTPYDFSFWQFVCETPLDGVEGVVDLDLQFVRKEG